MRYLLLVAEHIKRGIYTTFEATFLQRIMYNSRRYFFSRHNSHFTGAFKSKLFSPAYYSVPFACARTFHLVARMREQRLYRINCEFFADRHICAMFPVYVNTSNKSYPLMNSFLPFGCLLRGRRN